jgi:hypothetical protein
MPSAATSPKTGAGKNHHPSRTLSFGDVTISVFSALVMRQAE